MSVINKTLKELNKRTSSSDHGVYVGPGKKSNNVGVIRLVLLILLVCSSCVFTYILLVCCEARSCRAGIKGSAWVGGRGVLTRRKKKMLLTLI